MNRFEILKKDKTAIVTCVMLVISFVAKCLQAIILHVKTDYMPATEENIINVLLGLAPTVLLAGYIILFYKNEKTNWMLSLVFAAQLAITLLFAWSEYQGLGNMDASFVVQNGPWIVYYLFLTYICYKGFDNITLTRVIIAGMSLYAMFSSVVTLMTLAEFFPEEKELIVCQIIAVVGFLAYYLATFLIVPRVLKETSIYY